jgi:hypothetical protein
VVLENCYYDKKYHTQDAGKYYVYRFVCDLQSLLLSWDKFFLYAVIVDEKLILHCTKDMFFYFTDIVPELNTMVDLKPEKKRKIRPSSLCT